MSKKGYILFYSFGIFIFLFGVELIYLSQTKSISESQKLKKREFVKLVKLPDLSIVTEAFYVRHRSLATIFDIYGDDPTLIEYFPSTFVYSHSHIINKGKDY
jgi:hypothetical protein